MTGQAPVPPRVRRTLIRLVRLGVNDNETHGPANETAPMMGRRGRFARLLGVVVVVTLALHLGASVRAASDSETRVSATSTRDRSAVRSLARERKARGGERLSEILGPAGLSTSEVSHLAELVRPYVDPDDLPEGVTAAIESPTPGSPGKIAIRLDRDRTLRFHLMGARWVMGLDSASVTKDTVVVAGRVGSNLYSASLSGDADRLTVAEKGELVAHLSRVFAWQIDFYREVGPGDAFRLALEREVRRDGSVRRSRVLAAEYMRADALLTAHRFRPAGELQTFFYDGEGNALRKAFLKAPLDFVRVTSRFEGGRFHPMLERFGRHRGIDYGAASGTPVRATGEGTVERAGSWGGYGLVIEVRHGGHVRTRYAHLSAVERGIKPGASVEQGQTIGRVGTTGLSTAPHLHYEFRLRGIPTDPTRVDLPVERPILDADRERFARARAAGWSLLSRVSWPGEPLALSVRRRVGAGGHTGP